MKTKNYALTACLALMTFMGFAATESSVPGPSGGDDYDPQYVWKPNKPAAPVLVSVKNGEVVISAITPTSGVAIDEDGNEYPGQIPLDLTMELTLIKLTPDNRTLQVDSRLVAPSEPVTFTDNETEPGVYHYFLQAAIEGMTSDRSPELEVTVPPMYANALYVCSNNNAVASLFPASSTPYLFTGSFNVTSDFSFWLSENPTGSLPAYGPSTSTGVFNLGSQPFTGSCQPLSSSGQYLWSISGFSGKVDIEVNLQTMTVKLTGTAPPVPQSCQISWSRNSQGNVDVVVTAPQYYTNGNEISGYLTVTLYQNQYPNTSNATVLSQSSVLPGTSINVAVKAQEWTSDFMYLIATVMVTDSNPAVWGEEKVIGINKPAAPTYRDTPNSFNITASFDNEKAVNRVSATIPVLGTRVNVDDPTDIIENVTLSTALDVKVVIYRDGNTVAQYQANPGTTITFEDANIQPGYQYSYYAIGYVYVTGGNSGGEYQQFCQTPAVNVQTPLITDIWLVGDFSNNQQQDTWKFYTSDGVIYRLEGKSLAANQGFYVKSKYTPGRWQGAQGMVAGVAYTLSESSQLLCTLAQPLSDGVIIWNASTKELKVEQTETPITVLPATNVRATKNRSQSQITVTWDAPAVNLSTVTGYNVYLYKEPDMERMKQNSSLLTSTSCIFPYPSKASELPADYYVIVETVYTNGAVIDSEKASFQMTSVEGLTTEDEECEYFDLQGRRVEQPSKGIYLRRSSTGVEKVIR